VVADLKFFELDVLSIDVGRIAHDDHRKSILSSPFGVNSMRACILDNSVEDVVGGDRQNPCADLLERQFDGVAAGDTGTGDDRDDRMNTSLPQLEGEDDAVDFKQEARFVHFGREPVGEVRHQVLGEPRVHLLVGEHRLPVGLIADVVAKLNALRDELLGPARALFSRKANHGTIIVGLVSQRKPSTDGDRGKHTEADAEIDQPLRRLVHGTSPFTNERDANGVNDQRSGRRARL
jgi:hypothetical protein